MPPFAADTRGAYPAALRGSVTDDYFGATVAQPYRWLENVNAPETTAWMRAESAVTRAYLDAIPQHAAIANAERKLANYERVTAPFRAGPRYFYSRNSGLQNESVLYVRDGENGEPRVLLDPNALAADGTVAIAGQTFTLDGALMAYATQSSGADWQTWHVMNVATGNDLPDQIAGANFPARRGKAMTACTMRDTTYRKMRMRT